MSRPNQSRVTLFPTVFDNCVFVFRPRQSSPSTPPNLFWSAPPAPDSIPADSAAPALPRFSRGSPPASALPPIPAVLLPISRRRSSSAARLFISLLFSRESPSTMCRNFSTSRRSVFSRSCSYGSVQNRGETSGISRPTASRARTSSSRSCFWYSSSAKRPSRESVSFSRGGRWCGIRTKLAFDVVDDGILGIVVVAHEKAVRLAHVRVQHALARLLAVLPRGLRRLAVLRALIIHSMRANLDDLGQPVDGG